MEKFFKFQLFKDIPVCFFAFRRYVDSMKVICSQVELNSALQLVSRAVATRPTHPVLANVLLTADQGTSRLSLTGFDLNLGIQTALPASVEKSGAITLPAKLLGEIVSRLSSEDPITLISSSSGEELELTSLSGSYKMRGMSADDFPDLPFVESGTTLKINKSSLLKALRSTLFASSSDEAKQLLTGVNFSFKTNSIKAAATDGHRLAVLNIDNAIENRSEEVEEDNNEIFEVTLPSRSLRELERLISAWKVDEQVSLFFEKGQVVFLAADQVVTSRTLEGSYPNYSQLLPEEFSRTIELDRKHFISSLERVAVLAEQHNNVVKITSDSKNMINISADVQDVGSGSESIPGLLKGEDIQIAFNVRYLLDGLKAINSERIIFNCNAATTPAVFSPINQDSEFIYLVMPVQVRS